MDAIHCLHDLIEVIGVQVPEVVALLIMNEEAGRLFDLLQEMSLIVYVDCDDADILVTHFFLEFALKLWQPGLNLAAC